MFKRDCIVVVVKPVFAVNSSPNPKLSSGSPFPTFFLVEFGVQI